jgi:hypothetical protein
MEGGKISLGWKGMAWDIQVTVKEEEVHTYDVISIRKICSSILFCVKLGRDGT